MGGATGSTDYCTIVITLVPCKECGRDLAFLEYNALSFMYCVWLWLGLELRLAVLN